MHTLIALFNFEFFRNAFLAAFMASITRCNKDENYPEGHSQRPEHRYC